MDEKLKMKPAIEAMKVGDEISFPIEKLGSVKTTACNAGLILNRNYSTNVNRAERTVNVIRIA